VDGAIVDGAIVDAALVALRKLTLIQIVAHSGGRPMGLSLPRYWQAASSNVLCDGSGKATYGIITTPLRSEVRRFLSNLVDKS
jgi:hypothetical protein